MDHRPMWMSNFSVPSPRNSVAAIGKILDARYWPFIVSLIFSGFSRGAPRIFSLSLILRYFHLLGGWANCVGRAAKPSRYSFIANEFVSGPPWEEHQIRL